MGKQYGRVYLIDTKGGVRNRLLSMVYLDLLGRTTGHETPGPYYGS